MKKSKPTIELYLKEINQEKIGDIGKAAGCDYYISWTKECCILNFTKKSKDEIINPGLMMRKESFGGLVWDPKSGKVYEVNDIGYEILEAFDKKETQTSIAKKSGLEGKEVKAYIDKVRSLTK